MNEFHDQPQKMRRRYYNENIKGYLLYCKKYNFKPVFNVFLNDLIDDYLSFYEFKYYSEEMILDINGEDVYERIHLIIKKTFINDYSPKKLKAFIKKNWKGYPKKIVSFLKEIEEFYKRHKAA